MDGNISKPIGISALDIRVYAVNVRQYGNCEETSEER
jgi:hypothetical protein